MRVFLLFTRTRRWRLNYAILLATALAVYLCGPLSYTINPQGGYLVTLASQLPLVSAIFIQSSLSSNLAQLEARAVRSMGLIDAAHLIVLSVTGAILFAVAVAAAGITFGTDDVMSASDGVGAITVVRNLLALTGASYIIGAALGAGLGWVGPIAWSVLPLLILPSNSVTRHPILALISQPDDSFDAALAALIVWLASIVLLLARWKYGRLVKVGRVHHSKDAAETTEAAVHNGW